MALPADDGRDELRSLWAREDELKARQTKLEVELSALRAMLANREADAQSNTDDLAAVQRDVRRIYSRLQGEPPPPTRTLSPQVAAANKTDKAKPSRSSLPSAMSKTTDNRSTERIRDQGQARGYKKEKYERLYPPLHPKYPMVIMLDGKPTAIACHVCGANANRSSSTNGFLKGVIGLQYHVGQRHPELAVHSIERAISLCARTSISSQDAELIRNGQAPSRPMPMTAGLESSKNSRSSNRSNPPELSTSPPVPPAAAGQASPELHEILCRDNHRNAIYIDKQWQHISCHICGANASCGVGRGKPDVFFTGWPGLLIHMTHIHPLPEDSRWTKVSVLDACNKSPINAKTVDKIRRGEILQSLVAMRFGNVAIQDFSGNPSLCSNSGVRTHTPPQAQMMSSSTAEELERSASAVAKRTELPAAAPQVVERKPKYVIRNINPNVPGIEATEAQADLIERLQLTEFMTGVPSLPAAARQIQKRNPDDLAKIGPFKKPRRVVLDAEDKV